MGTFFDAALATDTTAGRVVFVTNTGFGGKRSMHGRRRKARKGRRR
jgi:hypothetical protein